jgi:hypothetical protein
MQRILIQECAIPNLFFLWAFLTAIFIFVPSPIADFQKASGSEGDEDVRTTDCL